jgi:crossover junction endodeoxyribonuclease RuvC
MILGYGVIDSDGDAVALVAYDALKCRSRCSMGERLFFLYRSLCEVISEYQPDEIAIETPFVAENARTALAIGKAQAIALLAAASNSIPAFEYSPTAIKYNTASYGASSKQQVQEMVRLQLNLKDAPTPNDCADALAAAICHVRQSRLNNLTGGK